MTSLLSRETSAPVCARVKNAIGWRVDDGEPGDHEGQRDHDPAITRGDSLVHDALEQQGGRHDEHRVEDDERQERDDRAAVVAGVAEDPAPGSRREPVLADAPVARERPGRRPRRMS
jgi:hypothetical protein